jgi:type IV pilus assembly protein PilM
MPLRLSTTKPRGTVGLDIDGRFLAAVQAGSGRLERAASTELPEGTVHDGEVVNSDALSRALRSFFKANDLPRNVRLGIANQQIVVRQIELPQIDGEAERAAAVRFQAAEAIAMPLDDAVLDYQIVSRDPDADGNPRMQVVIVAARRGMVERLVGAVKAAGLKPVSVDLDAFALVRALAREDASTIGAHVFCHLGGVTNLAIAVGDLCLFTRPVSAAWDGGGAASVIADEIRLSLDYYMTQPGARAVNDVVLSGPGSKDPAFVEELSSHTGLDVTVAEPLGRFRGNGVPAGEPPHRFTVAVGLAMGEAA